MSPETLQFNRITGINGEYFEKYDIYYCYTNSGHVIVKCRSGAVLTKFNDESFGQVFSTNLLRTGWSEKSLASLETAIYRPIHNFVNDFDIDMVTGDNECQY